ncbi:hypothetical protein GCM10023333_41630 [Ferrimonas pelagia]|uniref:Uncharacterized protein n=1 Tax=Ferrimonas pelagia TaxID=1177826 RepID=A0ABP9FIG4_9GAMM
MSFLLFTDPPWRQKSQFAQTKPSFAASGHPNGTFRLAADNESPTETLMFNSSFGLLSSE